VDYRRSGADRAGHDHRAQGTRIFFPLSATLLTRQKKVPHMR
jgi:hypothetical protein